MKDFRNKPNPVKMRITYLRGTLEVSCDNHVTGHVIMLCVSGVGSRWNELCGERLSVVCEN